MDRLNSPNHTNRMLDKIAARIRQRIHELGTNQTDVAQALGWTQQRFGNYYHGRRMPDLPSIVRIAQQLDTSVDWLLGSNGTHSSVSNDVLRELLAAAGLTPEKSQIIVDALAEAMRLLAVVPGEADDPLRSRMAVHAAWHSQSTTRPS